MVRRGWWMALVLVCVGGAGCRESSSRSAPATFSARPQELRFAPTALGDANELELLIANQGTSPFKVYKVEPSVPGLELEPVEPFELVGGAVRVFKVRFAPGVEGQLDGSLAITTDSDTAGELGVARIPFSGIAVKAIVGVGLQALDFGNVELESVRVKNVPLHNPSTARTRFRIELEGDDADQFSSSDASLPIELDPGEQKDVAIAFKPTRMGAAQARAMVSVCPMCEPVPVALSGSGVTSMLEVTPLRVDFGRVPVGATADETIYVRNLGTEGLPFDGISLLTDGGGTFAITRTPVTSNGQLAPGASLEVGVSFSPKADGPVPNGLLHVAVKAPNTGSQGPKIALVGEGGRGCVAVVPPTLDFGLVPEGVSHTRQATVLNRCPRQVWLSDFQLATRSGGFFSLGTSAPSVPIGPAASVELPLVFTPRAASSASEGQLTFRVHDGGSTSTGLVRLVGTSRKFAPCSHRLVPAALDFGRVPVGAEVTLGLAIENTGTDECFVSRIGLASGSDAAFTAIAPESPRIAPGGRATLLVRFKPETEGSFGGLAEAYLNHPTDGHPTVPLSGEGAQSCFTVQPTTVDFGRMKLGCERRQRPLVAKNQCSAEVTIDGYELDPNGSPDLSVGAPSALRLASGAQATFAATYAPGDEGRDTSALRMSTSQGGPYTVGLLGSAEVTPLHTDRFFQQAQHKVDLLFVIDNSGSMMEEQQNLARNFAALLSAARAQQVDYRIAVTTTGLTASPGGWTRCPGGVDGGENGRLFPVNGQHPRIITPQTPNAEAVFASNVQVGWCHWNEQGLDAAYRALSEPLLHAADDPRTPQPNDGNAGFLRPDAKLAIVFVTDEEDFSTQPVGFYETYFRALKNNDESMLSISAIAGPEDLKSCPTASSVGKRYLALARATGGVEESICTPNWAGSLENLSNNAFGPRRSYPLTQAPGDPTRIQVTVDGASVTTGWSYEPGPNAVVFAPESAPSGGSYVEVTYPLGC